MLTQIKQQQRNNKKKKWGKMGVCFSCGDQDHDQKKFKRVCLCVDTMIHITFDLNLRNMNGTISLTHTVGHHTEIIMFDIRDESFIFEDCYYIF